MLMRLIDRWVESMHVPDFNDRAELCTALGVPCALRPGQAFDMSYDYRDRSGTVRKYAATIVHHAGREVIRIHHRDEGGFYFGLSYDRGTRGQWYFGEAEALRLRRGDMDLAHTLCSNALARQAACAELRRRINREEPGEIANLRSGFRPASFMERTAMVIARALP